MTLKPHDLRIQTAMKYPVLYLLPLLLCGLSACEQIGIPDRSKEAAAKEAEGRAIGSACRQAGRALEDCYTLNPDAHKAAIFSGWRDMNDYMTENKLDIVKPTLPPPSLQSAAAASAGHDEEAKDEAAEDEAPAETTRKSSRRRSSSH